jgi:hypothetical protein
MAMVEQIKGCLSHILEAGARRSEAIGRRTRALNNKARFYYT